MNPFEFLAVLPGKTEVYGLFISEDFTILVRVVLTHYQHTRTDGQIDMLG